ncbi:MAG: SLC13 family permease, partial [Brevundimonas sp.]
TAAVTLLSMATKNVGALAIMLPVAQQVCRKTGTSPSRLLMPMSFGAMIGGLVTLVGTAPNIIVSEVREELLGKPFGMYDYAPVGLVLTAISLVFLSFAYRLLPKNRQEKARLDGALKASTYLTEVAVPEDWSRNGMTLGELTALSEGDVVVAGLLRGRRRKSAPRPDTVIQPGDVLLIEGEQQALDALILRAKLQLTRHDRPVTMEEPTEDVRAVEAVIGPESVLVGKSATTAQLYTDHGVNLLGVSRAGYRMNQHLKSVRLKAGDILLLQAGEQTLPAALSDLGCLPLAEREVRLGGPRKLFAPVLILAAAMTLVALGVIPVAIAFFGAAVAVVAIGGLRMREAYAALDGPLLVLIACLIPVSDAIKQTGGSALAAHGLGLLLHNAPGIVAVGGMVLAAMIVTPFLNNAATVLI